MIGGIQEAIGVELVILANEQYVCRYCRISRNQGQLELRSVKTLTGNLVDVIGFLPKGIPMSLSISGKGIVHKNIELTTALDFKQVFPAIQQDDFYIQDCRSEHAGVLSIARKDWIDGLLAKLKPSGQLVYLLGLGGLPVLHLQSLLKEQQSVLRFAEHELRFDAAGVFSNYRYLQEPGQAEDLELGGLSVSTQYLTAYAAAFQLLMQELLDPIRAEVRTVDADLQAFSALDQLKKYALIFILGLFITLLASFFLLMHLNDENAMLAKEVGAQASTADQAQHLKDQVAQEEMVLKSLSWNGGYRYGFLLDQLASGMPKRLSLDEIQTQASNQTEVKPVADSEIRITGQTSDLASVNNWMFLLKEKKWLKTVRLLSYQELPESENYQFKLIIQY